MSYNMIQLNHKHWSYTGSSSVKFGYLTIFSSSLCESFIILIHTISIIVQWLSIEKLLFSIETLYFKSNYR